MSAEADDEHIEKIATAAGKAAARELALLIGIDASTPAGIQRAQRNWAFLDDLREGAAAVKRNFVVKLLGAIVTFALAYLALAFGVKH